MRQVFFFASLIWIPVALGTVVVSPAGPEPDVDQQEAEDVIDKPSAGKRRRLQLQQQHVP